MGCTVITIINLTMNLDLRRGQILARSLWVVRWEKEEKLSLTKYWSHGRTQGGGLGARAPPPSPLRV